MQLASVFDPLSARAAADLGFEAAFLAGSVAALAVLGAPDLNLLTMSEFADLARRICRSNGPPLLVDADEGYGNALNVRRTVEELAAAGVAGLTLEDTILPRRFDESAGMTSIVEAERKLAAALEARPDPDFVVIARTSALLQSGLDAACARTAAYAAAGVDGIFVVGVRTVAELTAIHEAAGGTPVLAYAMGEIGPDADLAAMGVRLLIMGHAPFAQATNAAYRALATQLGQEPDPATPHDLVARLSEAATYLDRTRRLLNRGDR